MFRKRPTFYLPAQQHQLIHFVVVNRPVDFIKSASNNGYNSFVSFYTIEIPNRRIDFPLLIGTEGGKVIL